MHMSKSTTQFRGIHPRGWGGTRGRYPDGPDNYVINNPNNSPIRSNAKIRMINMLKAKNRY
jgi:hypothetical protein